VWVPPPRGGTARPWAAGAHTDGPLDSGREYNDAVSRSPAGRPLHLRGTHVFVLASLAVASAALVAFRSTAYARNPDVLAWAFTFDLTLTIPLLYYALVVRGGAARAVTIAPVFVICVAVAMRLVPHDQQQFVHQLRYLTAPLDIVTMWLVARRGCSAEPSGSPEFGFTSKCGKLLLARSRRSRWPRRNRFAIGNNWIVTA